MLGKVIWYTMLNNDVLELVLELSETPEYRPWQWALLSYDSPTVPLKRAYSIVNYKKTPTGCQLTFAIKLLPEGKGGQELKTLKIWDNVEVAGIYGHFVLQDTPDPKVFVGTGTWLAPLISMAETTTAPKVLYFSVSYASDLFYKDRIKNIPDLISYIFVSRESIPGCEEGRIDLRTRGFNENTEFYLCGKPETVLSFKNTLMEQGYSRIFTESY